MSVSHCLFTAQELFSLGNAARVPVNPIATLVVFHVGDESFVAAPHARKLFGTNVTAIGVPRPDILAYAASHRETNLSANTKHFLDQKLFVSFMQSLLVSTEASVSFAELLFDAAKEVPVERKSFSSESEEQDNDEERHEARRKKSSSPPIALGASTLLSKINQTMAEQFAVLQSQLLEQLKVMRQETIDMATRPFEAASVYGYIESNRFRAEMEEQARRHAAPLIEQHKQAMAVELEKARQVAAQAELDCAAQQAQRLKEEEAAWRAKLSKTIEAECRAAVTARIQGEMVAERELGRQQGFAKGFEDGRKEGIDKGKASMVREIMGGGASK